MARRPGADRRAPWQRRGTLPAHLRRNRRGPPPWSAGRQRVIV